MKPGHTTTSILLALSILLTTHGIMAADPKAEAKQHFESGVALLKVSSYASAATEFEQTVALYPTTTAYFNLASCYRALNRFEEARLAIAHLEATFGADLDDKWQREVSAFKEELDSLTAKGQPEVVPGPPVTLLVRPDAPVAPPPMVQAQTQASDTHPTQPLPTAKKGLSPLFWIGTGGAVLSGAAWAIFGSLAIREKNDYGTYRSDYMNLSPSTPEYEDEQLHLWGQMNDSKDKVARWGYIALGSAIGTGVFAALAITGLIIGKKGESADETNGITISAVPSGLVLGF